ncbi:hypothetical protein [Fidelibacter multiformis]|uniref:hypothetical protein n=1 Tax=Fidelibacter multiformis TaxID=3377529 RepID=UPI0037DC63F0
MEIYKKIFSELRYPGQIDIFDGRSKIVKAYYPEKFKHWTIENNSIIRLHNVQPYQKSFENLLIEHKRLIYSLEDPFTENQFIDKLLSYKKKLEKIISIPIYSRVGIRGYFKVGYLKLEDFISKSKENVLFSSQFMECINKILNFSDLYIILQNSNSRLNMGPMKKDERNNYTNEFVENENMEDDYLLLDIDCFETDVLPKDLDRTAKRIYDRMNSIKSNLVNFFEVAFNG